MMRARNIGLMVAVCSGAVSQDGWLRYFTGGQMWGGRGLLLLRSDSPRVTVVLRSTYDAEWLRHAAINTTVESVQLERRTPISRVIEIISDLTGGVGRVGMLPLSALTISEFTALRRAVPRIEIMDMTEDVNRLRQIKSPFELAAIRDVGRLLSDALDMFAERARPGRPALEVAGEIEGFLRGRGCSWGIAKYSLNGRPYLYPAPLGRKFTNDDIVLFEMVQAGPFGYCFMLSRLYSFRTLPRQPARILRATEEAMKTMAALATPGSTYRSLRAASDRIFEKHGLQVIGKHTVDGHSIGTDINDGPPDPPDDWMLQKNMVLALHPATLLKGDRAFFLCDLFVVEERGAKPLSPPRASRYQRLRAR